MILSKYADNSYVIKEDKQKIDLDALNIIINKFLKNRNELDKNASVSRAIRFQNYIVINCYASLNRETLLDFIKTFLNEYNIEYIIGDLSSKDLKILKSVLPVISIRKNDQHGGTSNDTPSIDPHVRYISKIFNSYPGITTFSSCEGHLDNSNKEANFYILFTVNTIKNLNRFSEVLWIALEEVMKNYKINSPQLMFDYGDWPSIQSTYFELRVKYRDFNQETTFEAMNYLADLLTIKKD